MDTSADDLGLGVTGDNPWGKYASLPMIGGPHDGKTLGEVHEPGGYALRGAAMVMAGGEYRLHGRMAEPKEYRWVVDVRP
jgi:hypothetical protein